ncbi:MAG: hypothetical protein C5B56_01675 [Proteobacteria bacterium]|nr:MAG: hypothetical protein C5B56_01675 [Pseudomonadota bacterium]
MPDDKLSLDCGSAQTTALKRVLAGIRDDAATNDLLFLERWEIQPWPGLGAALRVGQIRRANPRLAAEIRAEISCGRPLTMHERAALAD